MKESRERRGIKTNKNTKNDKPDTDTIIGKEGTYVERYTEEIKTLENCTSTEIITQIVGELQTDQTQNEGILKIKTYIQKRRKIS